MYLFTGRGVELPQEKNASLGEGIRALPLCSQLEVPLYTLGKTELELTVGIGGSVQKYAPLAMSPSRNHAIVSPVTGALVGVGTRIHPLLGSVPCAFLRPSPSGKPAKLRSQWEKGLDFEGLARIAKAAGIVDECDGAPLYRKLRMLHKSGENLLVASALDDDPTVTSAIAVVAERGVDVAKGLELLSLASPNAVGVIAVYDDGGCPAVKRLPERIRCAEILRVRGKYPVWPALEKRWAGQRVRRFGAQALCALSRAVYKGEPMTDVVLTVAGDAVAHPGNVQAPVGTPIRHVLEQCGVKEARWVSVGSTMTGAPVDNEEPGGWDAPVTAGMRCVLALSRRPWVKSYSCIGCGRCMQVCPYGLMPYYIAQLCERGQWMDATRFGAGRCTGCGACSAICPSGIELSAIVRRAAPGGENRHEEWGRS